MNIILVQLILTCFSVFMIYKLFLHWKKAEISSVVFRIWILIWSLFILITIFPRFFELFLFKPFFVRVMDFGMIVAFVILTYLTFENNVKIKKYEQQIEKLIRAVAVKKIKK
jgi:hypothetical protein